MRYDDIPVMPTGNSAPQPDVTAWQDAHEPMVTLRAWVGTRGEVLVSTRWAEDVIRADVFEKPVLDMLMAMFQIARTLHSVTDAVTRLAAVQEALEAVKGDN